MHQILRYTQVEANATVKGQHIAQLKQELMAHTAPGCTLPTLALVAQDASIPALVRISALQSIEQLMRFCGADGCPAAVECLTTMLAAFTPTEHVAAGCGTEPRCAASVHCMLMLVCAAAVHACGCTDLQTAICQHVTSVLQSAMHASITDTSVADASAADASVADAMPCFDDASPAGSSGKQSESVLHTAASVLVALLESEINTDLIADALPPALLCQVSFRHLRCCAHVLSRFFTRYHANSCYAMISTCSTAAFTEDQRI